MGNEIQFNEPIYRVQEEIKRQIEIPEGKKGGLFTALTKDDKGRVLTNAVLAIKVKDEIELVGFIGKTWGTKAISYGVEGRWYF